MKPMPMVRKLAADSVQIRAGSFGAPQERPVVDKLPGTGIGAIALDFSQQRSHLLGMAHVTAFTNIYIPTGQLYGAVDSNIFAGGAE